MENEVDENNGVIDGDLIAKLMESYAKHIIEINFCDGSPDDFDKLTCDQLKKMHRIINMCVDWVNSY